MDSATHTTLYHGGPEPVTIIHDGGMFGGIFCSSSESAAQSHGPVVSVLELPIVSVLSHYELNYEIEDVDTIRSVLESECAPGADIDRAWEIVVEDIGCSVEDRDVEIFGSEGAGEAGWEAQRIRGRVAAALGYRAVEMRDEHGTTWLVVG